MCPVPSANHCGARVLPGTSHTDGISLDFRDLAMKPKKTATASSIRPHLLCLKEGLKAKGWLETGSGSWEDVDNVPLAETSLLNLKWHQLAATLFDEVFTWNGEQSLCRIR